MKHLTNPFDSLYVTETINPGSFVRVFSPFLVHDTIGLFRPGNVVLMGTQGSGKSMLLALLKPETMIAFWQAEVPFPLEGLGSRFIGAGINLTKSGAIDFGQRRLSAASDPDGQLGAVFADFLNYGIAADILKSVATLGAAGSEKATDYGNFAPEVLDSFAIQLASHEVWNGAMADCESFGALREALLARMRVYRDFFNFNIDAIPAEVERTKTSAGQPISVAADLLRSSGVIGDEIEVFIRIDQYEELGRMEEWQGAAGDALGSVVHKMLGLRDARVSYRIGTRPNSWPERPRMFGTAGVLEELRNYKPIDLDDLLRAREHSNPFSSFAEDVFRRRLAWAGFEVPRGASQIGRVFGNGLKPSAVARLYVTTQGSYVPPLPADVPESARRVVTDLAHQDPVEATLAAAYGAQRGWDQVAEAPGEKYPWEARVYWRKERISQALMQIAARQRQRMLWAGRQDVVRLAGGNVLVFVSLCQSIWDAWIRAQEQATNPTVDDVGLAPPRIKSPYIQDEGIRDASAYWHRKIRSDPEGDQRQRFVNVLGTRLRDRLRDDSRMSYPGHNGFSLSVDELERDEVVDHFLRDAVAFGVLVEREHSTRSKGEGRRYKWYLAPIYSPYFQLPSVHTKEPWYVHARDVRGWMAEAEILERAQASATRRPRTPGRAGSPDQINLFDVL
jgi:hypothetical protein